MKVELSLGDVVDKISILQIKSKKMSDPSKRRNVERELRALTMAWQEEAYPDLEALPQWEALLQVNQKLWGVEDDLRMLERQQDFGERFVLLARSVYFLNDQRAALKRSINDLLGSTLVEEKLYPDYQDRC